MARRSTKPVVWKGRARLRRLFRQLPQEVRAEMVAVLQSRAPAILAYARSRTPRRTGALANALKVKVYPKTLILRMGLIGKAANKQFFYGRILERGRKAQTVTVRRGNRQVSRGRVTSAAQVFALRVRPISENRFSIVDGDVKTFARNQIEQPIRTLFERALRRMSGVPGGD